MQVEIQNKEPINLPLLGHVIIGTDKDCDIVLASNASDKQKVCSVIHDKSTCILEILGEYDVTINGTSIKEMAIIHPGDSFSIGNEIFKIIDDNKLPKLCNTAFKLNHTKDFSEHLITSVSGLRSYNNGSNGELHIIGNENSFTYKPEDKNDTSFSVSYINNQLTILCQKDKNIQINGNSANYALLENGDYITTEQSKFCVESPGTSSFSKYSPSHPRNIQLSEEYLTESSTDKENNNFIKKNLWWMTLLVGLIVIATILFYFKNN